MRRILTATAGPDDAGPEGTEPADTVENRG
jgi:hypothetical protein